MQELRFKIRGTESANVEIIPTSDGVEIVVKYGSYEKKPSISKGSADDVIEKMKAAANSEYKKPGADREEIVKFVKFYEKKIQEEGWKGKFDFSVLYERWLKNKR